jgi:hypothetical protein
MSLIKSVGDSNAAGPTSNYDENSGPSDAGHLGYVLMPFPSQMPAQSNADVTIQKDSIGAAQQGTSLPAYANQPTDPDAETGA